uniref:FAS1 domain-containing protein n=2 Tax=Aegilops tauschii TaxID=37682 RepID=A0A453EFL1_AEGTS
IARLRDRGYGFMALAMRVQLAELERFANLTLFALDDQDIFVGGGHHYVSALRFHIVPDHRLTHAGLLRLRPGTILPTLAGEGQSLVVTNGAGSASAYNYDVSINYMPIKELDVVVNSRIAVHGVYMPFPRPHLVNLAASAVQTNSTCGVGGPFGDRPSSATTSPKGQVAPGV